MSSTIWWIILGLLLGWLIEWVIDWVYWRRRQEEVRVQVRQEFHGQVQRARADEEQLQAKLKSAKELAEHGQSELALLRGQLDDFDRVQSELKAATALVGRREAELATLRNQLADYELMRANLQSIIALADHRKTELDDLRAQIDDIEDLRAQVAGIDGLRADLQAATALAQQRESEIASLRAQLAAGTAATARTERPAPATLGAEGEAASRAANFATVQLSRDDLEAQARLLEHEITSKPAARDPLIDINGIGPVYQRKLFAAGIDTFADLAALTAEQLREIVQPEHWQDIDFELWIAEARQFAQKPRD